MLRVCDPPISKRPSKRPQPQLAQIAATYNENEIQKLVVFLMNNYPGRLEGKKSPVDIAIELLERRM